MKRIAWMSGGAGVLSLLFLLAGCGSDNNSMTGPGNNASQQDAEAVAEDYSAALAGQDEGMLGMWSGTGFEQPGPLAESSRDRSGALDDTVLIDHNGFHLSLIRIFYDVNGNGFVIYDPLTSVWMERWLTIDGTHTNQSGRRTVTLHHADHLMIDGIAPQDETYRIDGDGEREVESEFSSRFHQNTMTYAADYEWTVTGLVIAHDRVAQPYPLDGSIAVDATITRTHVNPGRDDETTRHLSFTVTFDGTRYAQLVFTGGMTFWIDLANGDCHHDRP